MLSEKIAITIIKKMFSKQKSIELIDKSFLNEDMKTKILNLIEKRISMIK